MEQELTVNESSYRIVRLLGKGKGGYSYLAERDGQPVVIKQIHHEPCDYYTFGNKIEAELRDYARLQKAGIRIPGMHAVDKAVERILKDYIEGPTVMQLVQSGASAEPYLPQVRDMAAKAMAAGLNIDYYPTNFVVQDGLLWYVDYECNDYSEQWDFEHWGIQYWLPKASFRNYRDEDYEAVCEFLIELNRKDRALKDDSGLAIAINTENVAEIRAAELAGFERINQRETIMELSLGREFSSNLPEGLQLREMDQIADRDALEWLFWQGFNHGDDREALNRAKALGAKKAYVISDLPFYEKLGFEKTQHYVFYRKA